MQEVQDKLGRQLRDLRISVTDRCNFRCRYCMPAEVFGAGYEFLPKDEILRFGEVERLAKVFVSMGVRKLRLTGGEPLLRRDLHVLVRKLAEIEGVEDLAMTTNGVLLAAKAEEMKKAGLQRVTVSLDAMDQDIFGAMNGVGAKVERVVEGIDAALAVGLGVKINAVVKKGVNEGEVPKLAAFARERQIPVRFIEYMDTGNANRWKLDEVMPTADLLAQLKQVYPLQAVCDPKLGETSERFHLPGVDGFEVGFISSVTRPFCRDCNRARLSADGHLFTCLFASVGHDVKALVRGGFDDEALATQLAAIWSVRVDRYSEERAGMKEIPKKAEMSYLGG
ncbi:cyclic pyranopterin phosphate synthase [Rubritalea squalenifaciens DSM 18772]|uniref:GTP 3',8-cyclase n=1 Tax=Rubritalea squalenifaciens DSM 18772 TaxID=1123071 RepID=A0A1M6J9L6_9BACT|nr:GTP 3',8-cyclase MoaA [Rubritalea squalenifaciens]SHJ43379.1 cyclic pyranopterin phosphate synthase [Rubritalea squalenifaciens DSM 18772]